MIALSTVSGRVKLIAPAYGSRVRGDYRDNSDLDVPVIVKKDREIKGQTNQLN